MSGPRRRILLAGGKFAFPHGTGSTTRVLALARGLQSAGADVLVLPTGYGPGLPNGVPDEDPRGVFSGVPFQYAAGTTTRPNSFVRRRMARVRGEFGPAMQFASWNGGWSPDAVLLFTGHTMVMPMLTRIASAAHRSVMLFDGCEQPYVYEQDSARRRFEEKLYTPVAYRQYDGVFVISTYLQRYFESRTGPGTKTMLVPILVDVDRFAEPSTEQPDAPRYIAYTGEVSESKGVHDLITAFATLAERFPDIELRISGSPNQPSYMRRLIANARDLGVEQRVEFLGTVPYEAFPRLLCGATALVVPHPPGTFSEAAFPTKLGEYLASGVPTVITRVGEIDNYLRDGEDAFLVPPADPRSLADALSAVLRHPERAAAVGLRGRETARRYFDYRVHGRRMLEFIEDLLSQRRR